MGNDQQFTLDMGPSLRLLAASALAWSVQAQDPGAYQEIHVNTNKEKALHDALAARLVSPSIRPVTDPKKAVDVSVAVRLDGLLAVDEGSGTQTNTFTVMAAYKHPDLS